MSNEGSSSAGGAPPLDSKKPNEEVTIARPLKRSGPIQFTFQHRYFLSVPTDSTPLEIQIGATGVGQTEYWLRTQFRGFPVRSANLWMTQGEIALLLQFNAIKFNHASMKLSQNSYRTQFITGSTTIGFANSNMQTHSYCFQDLNNELPPYQWYLDGAGPNSPSVVTGANVNAFLFPGYYGSSPYTVGTVAAPAATHSYAIMPWRPWIKGGTTATTNAALEIDPSQDWQLNVAPSILHQSSIMGKKVKEMSFDFNLAASWNGLWVPIRPHLFPQFPVDYETPTPETPTTTQQTGFAGCWLGLSNIAGTTAIQKFSSLMICPATPVTSLYPFADEYYIAESASSTQVRQSGVYGTGVPSQTYPQDVWVAVEHLPNADGSIVPCVWDFVCDVEIMVEAAYETGIHTKVAQAISTYDSDMGTPKYRRNYIVPNLYQSINNRHMNQHFGKHDSSPTDSALGTQYGSTNSLGQMGMLGRPLPGFTGRP